jgi:hypothetical protein
MMARNARFRSFVGLLFLSLFPFAVAVCSADRPGELGNSSGFEGGPPLTDGRAPPRDAGDAAGDATDATVMVPDASDAGDGAFDAEAEAEAGPEVSTISWSLTKCGAGPCSIMGLKTSGFNEQALVSFKAVDINGFPVSGVPVSFRIDNPPTGTTTTPSGITDGSGLATATVQSGTSVGSFIVKASITVKGTLIEVDSPTIGVRGAKPSNRGFNFSCGTLNVGAYASQAPPRIMSVVCGVRLVDRFNNPVGTGTTVNFKSEAGSIPASIGSKLYDPGGTNAEEGTAAVTFSTQGPFPPIATDAFTADLTQYPNGRPAEPKWVDGQITRNPRDGLLTVIAYTRGEESFDDNNNNGTWDTGEQFIDEGETRGDANDNGTLDVGAGYVDESGDGQWNGPNGKWDINKNIWAEAHILYTNGAAGANSSWTLGAITVPRAALVSNSYTFRDLNMNVLASDVPLAPGTPGKGTVASFTPAAFPDSFGMTIERLLVDATTLGECKTTTARCKFRTVFTSWPTGVTGMVTFKGAALDNTDPPFSGTFPMFAGPFGIQMNLTVP